MFKVSTFNTNLILRIGLLNIKLSSNRESKPYYNKDYVKIF